MGVYHLKGEGAVWKQVRASNDIENVHDQIRMYLYDGLYSQEMRVTLANGKRKRFCLLLADDLANDPELEILLGPLERERLAKIKGAITGLGQVFSFTSEAAAIDEWLRLHQLWNVPLTPAEFRALEGSAHA